MAFIKTTWQIIELRPLKNEKQVLAVCVNIATDCNSKRQEPTNSSAGAAQSGSSLQYIHTFASMHYLCVAFLIFFLQFQKHHNQASVSSKGFILPGTDYCANLIIYIFFFLFFFCSMQNMSFYMSYIPQFCSIYDCVINITTSIYQLLNILALGHAK